jgi:ABC-type transport system involved in multi-copper enzyme maturation permease subunit
VEENTMIDNVRRVAATEFLEQRRQPWMIVAILANYLFVGALVIFIAAVFDLMASNPQLGKMVAAQDPQIAGLATKAGAEAFIANMMPNLVSFMFGIAFAIVALSSAYSVLHDRNEGTLPFLMLAPLSRFELLLGKVVGALILPVAFHFVINGAVFGITSTFAIMDASAELLGGTAAWWVAFAINVPLGTLFMGALAVIFSALSPDARTSYQLINFVLAIGSIILGYVVLFGVQGGLVLSFVITVGLGLGAVATLAFGSMLMSRDYVR